uniref:Uncharacterized protein n=1 Tax=Avena sativa TaxID=4498 RepID=A0ACD6AEI0_AVESA
MGSKDGPHLKAGLRYGATGATWSSSCSSSAVWPDVKEDKKKKPAARARARKPKRTSFACLECSKTFPTQQAMAGHCSAHTRAGASARRVPAVRLASHLPETAPVAVIAAPSNPLPLSPHHYHQHSVNAAQYWTPQVAPSTSPMPPLAIRYVPYARPASNQMMVRLPYLDPHGRRSVRRLATTTGPATNPAFRPAAWPVPTVPAASGRLGWRAFVPFYVAPPSFSANGGPPSDAASSTDRPGRTPAADPTLRLGSGRAQMQKTTLPLLRSLVVASDGQQCDDRKCKLVTTDDGGDRGSNGGKDQIQMGGLDLELRLCR